MFGIGAKKKPASRMGAPPSQMRIPVEEVIALSSRGFSEPEIVNALKKKGHSLPEIDEAMKQAIKNAATGPPTQHQQMRPSAFLPGPENSQPQPFPSSSELSNLPPEIELEHPRIQPTPFDNNMDNTGFDQPQAQGGPPSMEGYYAHPEPSSDFDVPRGDQFMKREPMQQPSLGGGSTPSPAVAGCRPVGAARGALPGSGGVLVDLSPADPARSGGVAGCGRSHPYAAAGGGELRSEPVVSGT